MNSNDNASNVRTAKRFRYNFFICIAAISFAGNSILAYLHYSLDYRQHAVFHAIDVPLFGFLMTICVYCVIALYRRHLVCLLGVIRLILWAIVGASVMIRTYDKYYFANMPDYLPLMRVMAMITWWVPISGLVMIALIRIIRDRNSKTGMREPERGGRSH